MKKWNAGKSWIAATFAFVSLATAAMAQVHVSNHPSPTPAHTVAPLATATPLPMPSVMTAATPFDPNKKNYVHGVPAGTRVPLSKLPRLPRMTAMNKVLAKYTAHGRRYHPMAATGATITVAAAAGCTQSGTGELYGVGCQLTITGTSLNNWSSTDTYQDYALFPNSAAAVAACATYVGNTDPGCTSATNTKLTAQGTYQFFVYDTTQQVIVASVWANAGQTFSIQIFSDAFHTQQQYQFSVATDTAAYIYLQNVAPSDYYVTYVQSTGVNGYCVYMTPSGTQTMPPVSPRPTGAPGSLLCNPTTSTGQQAAGGSLSAIWNMNSSLEAGAYSVVVYDVTQNVTLGSVQVSLSNGSGVGVLTKQTTPNPNPSPGFTPASTTILAWDSSTEQSVGGISALTQEVIAAGSYQWTMQDPSGHVVGTPAPQTLATNGTSNASFSFTGAVTSPPGSFPSPYWVLQLYEPSAQKVVASQYFEVVGYHESTSFTQAGVSEEQMNFSTVDPNEVTADLVIQNDGNVVYNGVADSFSGIEFTTGCNGVWTVAFTAISNTSNCSAGGYGNGVEGTLNGDGGGNACLASSGGCTLAVTDSNGGSWTFTDFCSVGNPAANVGLYSVCVMEFVPASGVVLPPGASITIPSMNWYALGGNNNWPCYFTPCNGLTTVLPTHGISWSLTTNPNSPTAWTPVTFGSAANPTTTLGGNARFDFIGSQSTGGAGRNVNGGAGNPWDEAHFFVSPFTRSDYQNSTPWTPATTRYDIASLTITDTGTETINNNAGSPNIAVGFPSYISPSGVTVDSSSTANWTLEACPASFGVSFVCFAGPSISKGNSSTLNMDIPLSVSSFSFQELGVKAYSLPEFTWFSLSNTGANTETYYNGNGATTTYDSLAIGGLSLNGNLMSTAFTPTTTGTGLNPTPLTMVFTNTSTAADPNPDSVDEIVIEQTTNAAWTENTASVTGPTGWSYLGSFNPSGSKRDYYFGLCAGQAVQADGPPQTTGLTPPLTAVYPSPPPCTPASTYNNVIAPGQTATINLSLNTTGGIPAGTVSFNMYAHGANDGGWTQPKAFTLTSTAESGSAGFQSVGTTCPGTAVPVNSLPTVGSAQNCYVYTIKNTSNTTSIGTVNITIPAFDINGLPAQNGSAQWSLTGSPITTNIKLGTISGGVFTTTGVPAGCAVSAANTSNPVPGSTNGQIQVTGCTGLTPGKILAVEFQAASPGYQSDSYLFPSTVDGIATGPSWIGDQTIEESFAIGLTVVVDPSNPGPGGSTPVVSCSQCAFSGSTIDFGSIANNASVVAGDVVRATVIYNGATTGTQWTLQLNATTANPTCTGAACAGFANELVTDADAAHSKTKCGTISPQQTTLAVVPPSATPMILSKGSETSCASNYYWDTIENYEVLLGTEPANSHVIQVLYTLIP